MTNKVVYDMAVEAGIIHEDIDYVWIKDVKQLEAYTKLVIKKCLEFTEIVDAQVNRIAYGEIAPGSRPVLHGANDYEYAEKYFRQMLHYETIVWDTPSASAQIKGYFGFDE